MADRDEGIAASLRMLDSGAREFAPRGENAGTATLDTAAAVVTAASMIGARALKSSTDGIFETC